MSIIDSSIYEDPKISQTLSMLNQGKSREEIYKYFGNKNWSSVDMYFRRRGFHWNGETFVPQREKTISAAEEATFLPTKSAQVVRQLNQKYADIRQIALKNGFASVDELGEYMKSQGYVWNSDANNYDYDETVSQKQVTDTTTGSSVLTGKTNEEDYEFLLDYLLDKKERLFELLETENTGTLPRYTFKGAKANKTLGLPTSLQTLLNDFSHEFNVTQRSIIEISLAEFFKKYGYEEQLNSVLHV